MYLHDRTLRRRFHAALTLGALGLLGASCDPTPPANQAAAAELVSTSEAVGPVGIGRELWSVAMAELTAAPSIGDVDGDGIDDIIVGTYDGRVRAFRADGTRIFDTSVGAAVVAAPAVVDLDRDGRTDIVVAHGGGLAARYTGQAGGISVLDAATGTVRWTYRTIDHLNVWTGGPPDGIPDGVYGTPAIGDLDGDGYPEVVFGGFDRYIHALDHAGRELPGFPLYHDDTIWSSPALFDVDNDGRQEVFLGGDSTAGGVEPCDGGVFRSLEFEDGWLRERWKQCIGEIFQSSTAIGDIDGDGRLEAVIGGGMFYNRPAGRMINAWHLDDGSVVPGWPQPVGDQAFASPTLADLTGDGVPEVVHPNRDGRIYAWSGNGRPLWSVYPHAANAVEPVAPFMGSAVSADLDGDGLQDVLATNVWGTFAVDGQTGQRLGPAIHATSIGDAGSPAIIDLGPRGWGVVLVQADTVNWRSRISVRTIAAQTTPPEWPMWRRNQLHTGAPGEGTPPPPVCDPLGRPLSRISGTDRYATAAQLSATTFSPGVGTAYIATGTGYADALAGGAAAARVGGPVLLVRPDHLPESTSAELLRLNPARIVVLGGPNAVSSTVFAQLRDFTSGTVERVSGNDRYATAAAVSAEAFDPGVPVVYMATGTGFADALAGAAAAGVSHGPVLLVAANTLPEATAAELARLQPRTVRLLGGPAAISAALEAEIDAASVGTLTRLAGADRYATAAALSQAVFPQGARTVHLATGGDFPDAVAAGPVAALAGGPLLLTTGTCVNSVVRDEIARLGASRVVVVGGSAARDLRA